VQYLAGDEGPGRTAEQQRRTHYVGRFGNAPERNALQQCIARGGFRGVL
jgi:hypothetical protein